MTHPIPKLGWKAELNLGFEQQGFDFRVKSNQEKEQGDTTKCARTVLVRRSQSGPLTVQRPFYPEGDVCHLYLLHPPGGVVGGDELHVHVDLSKGASTLITTPGATKFYRSGDGSPIKDLLMSGKLAQQIQTLQVADGCALEWFPQENIFFDQSYTHLSTRVELEKSARFMGWEINCYGRPASQALFETGKVMTRLEVYRDGKPLLLDGLLVEDRHALQSPTSLNGFPCFGTFVATQGTQELLEKARVSVEGFAEEQQKMGITLMGDLLIVRCLGQHAEQVSTTLKAVWSALRPDIMGRSVCLPRIWST